MSVGYLFLSVIAVIIWALGTAAMMADVPRDDDDDFDWKDQLICWFWPIVMILSVLYSLAEFAWVRVSGRKGDCA